MGSIAQVLQSENKSISVGREREIDLFVLVITHCPQFFVVKQTHRDPQATDLAPFLETQGLVGLPSLGPWSFLGPQTCPHRGSTTERG